MCIPQSKLDHGDLFTNKHVTGHHLVKYMLIHADNFTHTHSKIYMLMLKMVTNNGFRGFGGIANFQTPPNLLVDNL